MRLIIIQILFFKIYESLPKITGKIYSILVTNTTLASDNPLRFTKNCLGRIYNLIITIDDKFRDEKLQCDFKTEAAKISAFSSGEIDKYELSFCEEVSRSK